MNIRIRVYTVPLIYLHSLNSHKLIYSSPFGFQTPTNPRYHSPFTFHPSTSETTKNTAKARRITINKLNRPPPNLEPGTTRKPSPPPNLKNSVSFASL